jgi:N-acetylmuramoyl-L-alanine amidase
MGEIIIANQRFTIDAKVVNFTQSPFWNATVEACVGSSRPCPGNAPFSANAKNKSPRRYALRPQLRKFGKNPPLDATKALIKQFVLHHDGCWSAEMCWNVLHNERGLSCHFLIDNDGTIYQTIDLAFMAYHAAEYNVSSIGVEFCSRGDATRDPGAAEYSRRGMKRQTTPCKINGHTILAYDFAPPQYDAMKALARGLTRLLPNLPLEYPQHLAGKQSWDTMPTAMGFAGYMGHYHCTTRKWDPGPFDFKTFCEKLRGALCFPLWTGKPPAAGDKPVVPTNGTLLRQRTDELYAANEKRADGGFYPVGPWGEYRLWHGGVHLRADEKAPVYAPFPGRVVAARMVKPSPVGSVSFVLLRHDMNVGRSPLRFYSLYMHLIDESAEKDPLAQPAWMRKDSWKTAPRAGDVALLDEPVEAGEIIGRVGVAGPPEARAAQIHFEIFSTGELLTDMEATPAWLVIDGSAGGRACDLEEVNEHIDTNQDERLETSELIAFFGGAGGGNLDVLRRRIAYNTSEWTAEPDWEETLRSDPEFRDVPVDELRQMIADQITPTLWWTAPVAKHARLPLDGVVFHYHPISFVHFLNEKIVEAAVSSPDQVVDASDARGVPDGVVDDLGDETGESAVSDKDLATEDPYQDLTLEQILEGFDGDPLSQ